VIISTLGISEDSLGSASYACTFNALFSGRSHRLTSTLIKKGHSFSSVKTSQKSALFGGGAKSEPLSRPLPPGLRLLWPPLPAGLSAHLAACFPKRIYPPGDQRAYPVDSQGDTFQLGWRPSPGGGCGVAAS
jgi:hypothetical protein